MSKLIYTSEKGKAVKDQHLFPFEGPYYLKPVVTIPFDFWLSFCMEHNSALSEEAVENKRTLKGRFARYGWTVLKRKANISQKDILGLDEDRSFISTLAVSDHIDSGKEPWQKNRVISELGRKAMSEAKNRHNNLRIHLDDFNHFTEHKLSHPMICELFGTRAYYARIFGPEQDFPYVIALGKIPNIVFANEKWDTFLSEAHQGFIKTGTPYYLQTKNNPVWKQFLIYPQYKTLLTC